MIHCCEKALIANAVIHCCEKACSDYRLQLMHRFTIASVVKIARVVTIALVRFAPLKSAKWLSEQ